MRSRRRVNPPTYRLAGPQLYLLPYYGCLRVFLSGQVDRNIDEVNVVPVIDNKPIALGELAGDALSVISFKEWHDDADPDVSKRHSYRDLHRPDITHLGWVSQRDNKEEVRLYCIILVRKRFTARQLLC